MTAWQQRQRRPRPPRPGRLDPAVARERSLERSRREMEARRRASLVLADRHPEEFAALLVDERAGVALERGPLPGDPS
jgi:hypothetical protein